MFEVLKKAFPYTIPVLFGYCFLGLAYGLFVSEAGFPAWSSALMSLIIYAGSLQFVLVPFLLSPISILALIGLTVSISIRHLFYGLNMIETANKSKSKILFIHFLSDETYALISTIKPPKGIKEEDFYLAIGFLNYFYWAFFAWLGAIFGNIFTFNTQGLDFVLVALFVVLFVEQWKSAPSHIPAIFGVIISVATLIFFGPKSFMIPAMVIIILSLITSKNLILKDTKKNERQKND
ncbi:MAG: AzlC family ABC transporter permease [Peptoniphilaceae bacterium]|nr:AzlC family ABC transporter permease [Peptoniphilaceae bacterium]MDY6019752.1 AzlC family ABC transporter permease [Anaerococcus sp.]